MICLSVIYHVTFPSIANTAGGLWGEMEKWKRVARLLLQVPVVSFGNSCVLRRGTWGIVLIVSCILTRWLLMFLMNFSPNYVFSKMSNFTKVCDTAKRITYYYIYNPNMIYRTCVCVCLFISYRSQSELQVCWFRKQVN